MLHDFGLISRIKNQLEDDQEEGPEILDDEWEEIDDSDLENDDSDIENDDNNDYLDEDEFGGPDIDEDYRE